MKRVFLISMIVAACITGTIVQPAAGQSQGVSYVWDNQHNGEPVEDRSWCNEQNWNPTGVPDGAGDSVTIAGLPQGGNYQYAIFDCQSAITIGSLTLAAPSNNSLDELTFEDAANPRVLIITQRDGLSINAFSDILMQDNAVLRLDGGGVATINGTIWFDNPQTTPPKFMVGDGTNLTIADQGDDRRTFVGESVALITGQVGSPDDAEVLVLPSSARMCGSFDIDLILVNNGRVHTAVDCHDDAPLRDAHGKVNLVCHPKGGSGNWLVDGGHDDGQIRESKLNIDTGLASSGSLLVWRYGSAILRRPATFIYDVMNEGEHFNGHLMVRPGGLFSVEKDLAFDARWGYASNVPDCLGERLQP